MEHTQGLGSFLSPLKDYLPSIATIITGVLMPILTGVAGVFFHLFAFRCPCTSPENQQYAQNALNIPFFLMVTVACAFQLPSSANIISHLMASFRCNTRYRRFLYRCSMWISVIFMKNAIVIFASFVWIILASFNGDIYICLRTETLDWGHFPMLNSSFSRMSEKERRDVLAKVPCDNLNPFPGLVANGTEQEMKNEIVDFLSASALNDAWELSVSITVDAILTLYAQKRFQKKYSKLIERSPENNYSKFENQFIKQKTEELSKRLAEENVNLMFAHLNRVREQGHENTLPDEYKHVDCGESSSTLHSWVYRTRRQQPPQPSGREEDESSPLLPSGDPMQEEDQHGYQAV